MPPGERRIADGNVRIYRTPDDGRPAEFVALDLLSAEADDEEGHCCGKNTIGIGGAERESGG
jgi:hypothetical protein